MTDPRELAGHRVLMLVWTGVSTDARVLREATTLVDAGAEVHIIGRAVPDDFTPPPGITVDSLGAAPLAQGRTRELTPPERWARWALLPQHVSRRMNQWQQQAVAAAREWAEATGRPNAIHIHDFTALAAGHALAAEWAVPFIYDTHEYWRGRPVEGRPSPLRLRREARIEGELVSSAASVLTVGDGVAEALRRDHPTWPTIRTVHNTFPARDDLATPTPRGDHTPTRLIYAGRLAAYRELEVIAQASEQAALPITALGPADAQWLRGFDAKSVQVLPAEPLADVDTRLREAGAALVTHSDRWPNHRLAMPNKLFHAVSVGVPVVATDVGELGAMVRRHNLGTLYPPGDPVGLRRAIEELVDHYQQHHDAVRAAQPLLSWDADARTLIDTHVALSPGPSRSTRLAKSEAAGTAKFESEEDEQRQAGRG